MSDRAFCGAEGSCAGAEAGVVCGGGEVCSAGVCALSCQAGLTQCSDKCVDINLDRANCGACGNSCGSGAVCSAGACQDMESELEGLKFPGGTLSPAFSPDVTLYVLSISGIVESLSAIPTQSAPGTVITVNGMSTVSGRASPPVVPNPAGLTQINVRVVEPGKIGRTYGVVVVPGTVPERSYLKGWKPTTQTDERAASSLALSGDTLVVGAPLDTSTSTGVFNYPYTIAVGIAPHIGGRTSSGAVYVYRRTVSGWSPEAFIKASNADNFDNFGISVAIHGDTLVVGAAREASASPGVDGDQLDNSLTEAGAAYVFTRTNGQWSQQAYLKASNPESRDRFGEVVAVHGDVIAVAASREDSAARGLNGDQSDNSAPDVGAVYLFERANGAWGQTAYLKASLPTYVDLPEGFGASLSLSDDTLAVGAFYDSNVALRADGSEVGGEASGAAYVYVRTAPGTWSQQAVLKPSNSAPYISFGRSVSVSGNTLAVGADYEAGASSGVDGDPTQIPGYAPGAAYVFVRTGAVWMQEAYIKASNPDSGDRFGSAIAVSGDTLVVGARDERSASWSAPMDNSRANSGAAYVFARSGGSWAQVAFLKANHPDANDLFGQCVAVSGSTIVSGAAGDDGGGSGTTGDPSDNSVRDSGAVYTWSF